MSNNLMKCKIQINLNMVSRNNSIYYFSQTFKNFVLILIDENVIVVMGIILSRSLGR